jgi:hypothetical protein
MRFALTGRAQLNMRTALFSGSSATSVVGGAAEALLS